MCQYLKGYCSTSQSERNTWVCVQSRKWVRTTGQLVAPGRGPVANQASAEELSSLEGWDILRSFINLHACSQDGFKVYLFYFKWFKTYGTRTTQQLHLGLTLRGEHINLSFPFNQLWNRNESLWLQWIFNDLQLLSDPSPHLNYPPLRWTCGAVASPLHLPLIFIKTNDRSAAADSTSVDHHTLPTGERSAPLSYRKFYIVTSLTFLPCCSRLAQFKFKMKQTFILPCLLPFLWLRVRTWGSPDGARWRSLSGPADVSTVGSCGDHHSLTEVVFVVFLSNQETQSDTGRCHNRPAGGRGVNLDDTSH